MIFGTLQLFRKRSVKEATKDKPRKDGRREEGRGVKLRLEMALTAAAVLANISFS